MGKKPKSNKGKEKALGRKVDKSTLPPPPAPVEEEIGSAKLLDDAGTPGTGQKALGTDKYDDGGVADLTLVIDLEDNCLRRKRGENNYFSALKQDLLPRITTGSLAQLPRREQKVRLAKILFSEEDPNDPETMNPSEVWQDTGDASISDPIRKKRLERLNEAKYALRLSTILREPACASMALSEISKRYLSCFGKESAEDALRCAKKAILIASDGFYDSDAIAVEAEDKPKVDPKYEENPTTNGLSHPASLKYIPKRVSQLCLRAALLHEGNALSASGKDTEARDAYEKVLPFLENEPRCGRVDWERASVIVNIGNTYSRQGEFDKALEQYDKADKMAKEHLTDPEGSKADGVGIRLVSARARAFAMNKAGKEEEAKKAFAKVLELQKQFDEEQEKKKKEQEEATKLAEEAANQQYQAANPVEAAS